MSTLQLNFHCSTDLSVLSIWKKVKTMHICWFLVSLALPSLIESSFLFGLFDSKPACDAPFAKAPSLEGSLKKIWQGFWSCPYEPSANPGQTIDNFIRYFYIENGQSQYTEGSATDIAKLINKNNSNFIITHGFNDGVRIGGILLNDLLTI